MATTQTIHFEGKFKGKFETVPYCTRWGMRPKSGVTTSNKEEVNCTRCAKQLDITPAVKVKSSTRGTCQCCFGAYETRQKGGQGAWRTVLHGYERPRYGYIVGNCRGHGSVPYEVSCEQTKAFRASLETYLDGRRTYLHQLQTNKVPVLLASVPTGNRVPGPKGGVTREYKHVEVSLGQDETQNPFMAEPWNRVPSYETLRKNAIWETECNIRGLEKDIAFLTEKIATWKPVAFPIAK